MIGWVRELWGALQPFSSGGLYVNYEAEHDLGRVQAAYSPAKYARLAAVKASTIPRISSGSTRTSHRQDKRARAGATARGGPRG